MDQAVIDMIEKYAVTERTRSFLNAEKRHYINGAFVAGGEMMPVLDPCSGSLLAEVPSGTSAEIDAAVTWTLARAANLPNSQTDTAAEVLKLVNEIQRVAPGEERTLTLQLRLLTQTGQTDAAAEALEATLAREPSPTEASLLQMARTSQRAGLGLEQACYDRADEVYGTTPRRAFSQASL